MILHSVIILTTLISKLDFPKWAVKSIFGLQGLPEPSKVPYAHFSKRVCSLLKAKSEGKRQESGQNLLILAPKMNLLNWFDFALCLYFDYSYIKIAFSKMSGSKYILFARPSWAFKSTICTFFKMSWFIIQGQKQGKKTRIRSKKLILASKINPSNWFDFAFCLYFDYSYIKIGLSKLSG